jgi:glycosyltransferase involved in cell wall biosynthesis
MCDGMMDENACAPCILENQGVPEALAVLLGSIPLKANHLPDKWWTVKVASRDLARQHHETSREFLANAAHIVACSQWSRDLLVKNGVAAAKISVHRQAMPGSTRVRRLRLPIDRERTIRLGFLGRFVPDKGPDLLLGAIPHLRSHGLKIQCELSGPMNPQFEKWAKDLLAKHESEARYLGFIPAGSLYEWLASLDLLVIPSRWMELGTFTLLEAWDNGTPVIGSKMGGVPEFLDANGLSDLAFEINNPVSLADAVVRTLTYRTNPSVTVPGVNDLCASMETIYSQISGVVEVC